MTDPAPYRTAAAPPELAPRPPRTVLASLPSLAALVVTFFVPTIRDCGRIVSPARFSAETPPVGLVVAPPYLWAFALLALTLVALPRGPTAQTLRWVRRSLAVYGAGAALGAVGVLVASASGGPIQPAGVLAALLASALVAAGLSVWWNAKRHEGWARWSLLLATYALCTAGMPATMAISVALAVGSGRDVAWGAWLYELAYGALLVVSVAGAWAHERALAARRASAPLV